MVIDNLKKKDCKLNYLQSVYELLKEQYEKQKDKLHKTLKKLSHSEVNSLERKVKYRDDVLKDHKCKLKEQNDTLNLLTNENTRLSHGKRKKAIVTL